MQTENLLNSELSIDAFAQSQLQETAKWAKFLSIFGFVISGLVGLMALFARSFIDSGQYYGVSGVFVILIYLMIAVIYLILSLYLYRFAESTKRALYATSQEELNVGLLNLKKFFKVCGVIVLVYLCLLGLALLLSLLAASFS